VAIPSDAIEALLAAHRTVLPLSPAPLSRSAPALASAGRNARSVHGDVRAGAQPRGAAAHPLLRGARREDLPSDAAAPVRGYRQIYFGALIEPLIEDHLPRLVLVGHCDVQILSVTLLGSDAWRYAC
jgi:hypothetical protein